MQDFGDEDIVRYLRVTPEVKCGRRTKMKCVMNEDIIYIAQNVKFTPLFHSILHDFGL